MLHELLSAVRAELKELQFVRVLEYFEGDILREYRALEGGAVYLEKWCAQENQLSRWLLVRIDARALAEYLAGLLPLDELMTRSSDGGGFIIDRLQDKTIDVFAVRLNTLPPLYLPEKCAFHEELLRPEWDSTPQSFLLDNKWSAETFAFIERRYLEVTAFSFFTHQDKQNKFPPEILNYMVENGFAMGHAYRTLRSKIPIERRVRSSTMQAASPGVLILDAPAATAADLNRTLKVLRSLKEEFKVLYSWSKLSEEALDRIPPTAFDELRTLANSLNVRIEALFPEPSELIASPMADARSILVAGKLLASYWRRLWNVLKPGPGIRFIGVQTDVTDSEVPDEVFISDTGEQNV